MISSDLVYDLIHWNPTVTKITWHGSSMSRIIYLCSSARELHKTRTIKSHIRSFAFDTKARWCCPLHYPSSTAFVSKSMNHWTTCWILPKAGPKAWFPKAFSRWRSWVGLGVCLLYYLGMCGIMLACPILGISPGIQIVISVNGAHECQRQSQLVLVHASKPCRPAF